MFSTLEDIIAGGIISTIIYSTNIEVIKKKFEKISLFLDSNYLFRLFGLSFKEQNQPAEELFELIKSQPNIELRVFDFTIEEFTNVLKNYQIEQYYYPPGLKINSLYSSLKALGWTSADLKEFIVNLENKLKQFGISIYPTTVDLNVSSLFSEERRALLARYKTDQTFRGQNHDLSAIDQIRLFRKESKKKIESCEALFLSSDIKLSKFNYLEDKHKGNSTISEVMPDKLFTNYLWLKNPVHNKEIHISSWISLNKRHFYIDRSVWQAFYDNLKKLREKGKITDTDISILIYDKQIQSILTDTDPSDIEYIEAEWILDCIIKAKNRQDLFQKNKIKDIELFFDKEIERSKKEVEFLSKEKEDKDKQLSEADKKQLQLEERVKILEKENQEKTKQQIDAILKWKKQQETRAELIAHRWLLVISFLTMLLFFSILPILHGVILRNWNVIEPMMFLTSISFTIIIAIIGKRYDPLNIRRNIYDKIFQYVYNKKLKLINELEHQINVMSLPNIQEF